MRATAVPSNIAATSALLVVTVVNLTGQIFTPQSFITQLSQALIVPALAAILITATEPPRSRIVRLGFVALVFWWLGDVLPLMLTGRAALLAMMVAFAGAQVAYTVAFWPYRKRSILTKPILAVPYVVLVVVILALSFQGAGLLFITVIVYSVATVIMAIAATGMGPVGSAGGVLFLLLNALVLLPAFTDLELPGGPFTIMLVYVVSQALLVHAIMREAELNMPRPVIQTDPVIRQPDPAALQTSQDSQV
ncbi:lysoplasmalogenase family protein [Flaviflexus huanghaiensis]|uniref:lysoplasmalogenase family protein n=1 Tax=Flaviflexus huanghaiensis TaxID=1111473 RepID=UPI0015FE3A0C|nr:lysoplasmalogenase family protein [Flaviflexus huanghaiensis]